MTPERRRASPDTRAEVDAAMERSRRSIEEAAYGKPIVTVLSAPTGPMIVPGSRVTLRIEAIDMGHGIAMEPATIAMFVPTPTPWPRSPSNICYECDESAARARDELHQREPRHSGRALRRRPGPAGVPGGSPVLHDGRRRRVRGARGPPSDLRRPRDDSQTSARAHGRFAHRVASAEAQGHRALGMQGRRASRRDTVHRMEPHGLGSDAQGLRQDGWNEFHGCKGS